MNNLPNQVEMLSNGMKGLDKEIHQARVDKEKLELTAKHFKKIKDVQDGMNYSSKIINLENNIQATYDRIFDLEMVLKKGRGKTDLNQ